MRQVKQDVLVATAFPQNSLALMGNCLAKAQLGGTLASIADEIPLAPGVPLNLGTWLLPHQAATLVVGSVTECDVVGPSGTAIDMWTSFSGTEAAAPFEATLADPGIHVRGCWPSCRAEFLAEGNVDITPGPQWARGALEIARPNGPEAAVFSSDNSLALQARTNKGLYGADITYRIPVSKSNPSVANGMLILRTKNAQDWFAGAVGVANAIARIPQLPESPLGPHPGVELNQIKLTQGSGEFEFKLAIGGSASLPCTVQVHALGLAPPPEEP